MQLSETVLADEFDRILRAAGPRIDKLRTRVAEPSTCPRLISLAQRELDHMIEGVRQLRLRRERLDFA